MKRDIRINFGQLEDLCTTIANYRKELSDLQILSEELYQVLTAQTSNRLTELAEQWQERVIKKENQLENRLEAIQTLLSNYIYEMGNYIQPKDPDKLTQVDRNDIWWNLQQIVWEISSVYDPGGLAGTYYEPYNCEENDESVWKEDLWEGSVKQRQNREANYAKLRTFQTSFQNEILSQMQTDVWSIYDNHIVPYEETDDFYKEEALKYYLEYATFEDHCLDLYRREEDFGRGLNDQLKEIFEGLRVLSLFADETTRNAYINGELDEENTELMGNFIDGFREFFADPIGVLEAMGQKTMDRYEEEGLCYAAGYLSIDAGLTVCGGLKGLKSLTSLKFVDNATDTAQLAKHAENVVDIVDDTTDMAKIVENGNDVADSALDVGKVAEGGSSSKIGYEYLDDQLGNLKDKVKINQYQSAESVNAWWEARGYKSPYKEKTVVQNITLTEDTKFVRVYDGVNSNLEGGWVMRAEDIKGLTPKEIQAKFALEYEPKFIGEVELKAGDTVRLGEVGPNFGFDGGGIQIDLQQQWIGDFTELGKIEDWR